MSESRTLANTLPIHASHQLSEVYRIHRDAVLPSSEVAEEDYWYSNFIFLRDRYYEAIEKKKNALARGRMKQLEQGCLQYIYRFSEYAKEDF